MMKKMSSDGPRPKRRPRPLTPAQLPPGPLADLKILLYSLYTMADQPTLTDLTQMAEGYLEAKPSRDTFRRYIASPTIPPNVDQLCAITTVLARLAGEPHQACVERANGLWNRAMNDRAVPNRDAVDMAEPAVPCDSRGRPGRDIEDAIFVPIRDAEVGSQFLVRGQIARPAPGDDGVNWLAVRLPDNPSLIWPKQPELAPGAAGEFAQYVYEGGQRGNKVLMLIRVSPEVHREILHWRHAGPRLNWPAFEARPGIRILDQVQIRYRGPEPL
jgi:hypothetical protein